MARVPAARRGGHPRATGGERRKRFSVAALYTAGGGLVAHAAAVWITLREA